MVHDVVKMLNYGIGALGLLLAIAACAICLYIHPHDPKLPHPDCKVQGIDVDARQMEYFRTLS